MVFQQENLSTIKKPKFASKAALPIINRVNNSINTWIGDQLKNQK